MYCQPQVYDHGGGAQAAKVFIKKYHKFGKRLIASEGLKGLYQMPFFKNIDVDDWHRKVKIQNFPLKKMTSAVGRSDEKRWRKWALDSIDGQTNSAAAQLIYKEWHNLHRGALKSASLDEYEQLLKDKNSIKKKNQFLTAVQFGFDLVIPVGHSSIIRSTDLSDENQEVTTDSSTSAAPGEAESLLNEEELEFENAVGIDIERTGSYGPEKVTRFLGIGAALVGVAIGMSSKAGGTMDKWISKPINRGILMQTVAILAIANYGTVKKNLEIIEENRAYVQDIVDRFEVQEGVSVEGDNLATTLANSTETQSTSSGGVGVQIPRVGSTLTTQEQSELRSLFDDLGVPCADGTPRDSNDRCPAVNLTENLNQETSLGSLGGFQTSLQNLSSAVSLASNGNIDGATEPLNALTNNRNVRNTEVGVSQIQEELNKVQFENGDDIIDFKAQPQNLAREFNNIVSNEARRAPGGLNAFSSFVGQSPRSNNLQASLSPQALKGSRKTKVNKGTLKFSKPKNVFKKPSSKRKSRSNFNFFGTSSARKKVKSEEALKDRVVPEQSIIKNPGVSIFDALSHRYKQSAYDHFFKKKRGAAGKRSKK